jgi:sec-independent protein translocase protein TatB
MFDIGFWEMLVIGVMALLILGPERLPGAIRSTISTIRSIKDVANGFKQEVASQLDTHELHENLRKAESLGMKNIGKDLQNSVNELKAAAASVQQPYKTSNTHSTEASKSLKEKEKPLTAIEKPSSPETEIPSPLLTSPVVQKAKVRKSNNE